MGQPSYHCQTIKIVNPRGLHARAAAKLSETARQFQATVTIEKTPHTASADSILDLLMLMAGCGDVIVIKTTGPESDKALTALSTLVQNGFGEGFSFRE